MGMHETINATITEIHHHTDYLYEVGTCITHRDMPMPSLVMCRSKTGKGLELYGVRSFAYEDPNRDRLILGSSLAVPGKRDCDKCLLAMTGMCPRRP